MSGSPVLRPVKLKREGDQLVIDWSDGIRTAVTWQTLRQQCPCAACQEQRAKPPDPFRVLSPRELAAGAPSPVQMLPRGYYAYQIIWNDGHDTGIYTLENLRKMSQVVSSASTAKSSS